MLRRRPRAQQVGAAQHKHAIVAAAGLRPDERIARERALHPRAMVPDFDNEQTLVRKQRSRLAQYHAHGVKPVLAARERDGRFVAVLARELAHGVRAYVRRIRDNEIVVLAAHRIKHI